MDRIFLDRLLRNVLRASLVSPMVLGAACGGKAEVVTFPGDDAGGDASGQDAEGTDGTPQGDASPDGAPRCQIGTPIGNCDPSYTIVGDPAGCGLVIGQNTPTVCDPVCGTTVVNCDVTAQPNGTYQLVCITGPCGTGRRPEGMPPYRPGGPPTKTDGAVGSYFAHAAYIEAAAVDAFEILRRELSVHGAPARLVRAAGRAAADEVRHARATAAIARRHGGTPRAHRVAKRKPRSLFALARENAAEGCVRETFGALLAMWQAENAADPKVRGLYARIAPEETEHAALSWQVAAWAEPLLAPKERARIDEARRAAVRDLRAELREEPPPELSTLAGLPSRARAGHLLDELERALWA